MSQPPNGGGESGGGSSNAVCGTTSAASVVNVSVGTTYRTVKATGCPNYSWTTQSTPNKAQIQCHEVNIPLNPVISTTVFYVGVYTNKVAGTKNSQMVGGAIGISSNGVSLYGNQDANKLDAYENEGATFDTCKGHPQMQGDYHYHAEPGKNCVYTDVTNQHSPLFGFMYDGIPIYGPYGDNGAVPTNLDECGGHVDNTNPFYHYHVAYNYTYPYLVNCLRGCLNGTSLSQYSSTCTANATQYNYTSLKNAWVANNPTTYSCSTASSGNSLVVVTQVFVGLMTMAFAALRLY